MKSAIAMTTLMMLVCQTGYAQSGKKAKGVVAEDKKSLNMAKASQQKIDKLSDQTQTMLQKYRQTLKQIENAKVYNNQLRNIIKTQEEEKVSIKSQIGQLKDTAKGIVPLMVDMVKNIKTFVELDVPFLPVERAKRINDLESLLSRADVSTSEKFRRILEAYQVENEYGRTIESYRAIKMKEGNEMTVDYLQVGRIALLYQTLDGKETGVWDQGAKKWVELGSEYKKSVQAGIKMAKKQTAPQLVKLPVAAPKTGGTL
jgi:seryl-tRNA synthetase